ncbi:MAG: sugar nucleotide-binding protein, partial [Planctomycetes bacterium]|nr:sugar nucleotide-binding protein [Planctomycetota bacterium]
MRIGVTGADGQLGRELCRQIGVDAIAWDLPGFDITNRDEIQRVLLAARPEAIINCAAYTQVDKAEREPGGKAVLLLSTGLDQASVLMEVERGGAIAVRRRFALRKGQQRIELPVQESDRGGFTVHFLCVERGRAHRRSVPITVPWSNKQLHVEWMSFRDKLRPGDEEEWRLTIEGP